MEFGCRYIYIHEQEPNVGVEPQHFHSSPRIPQRVPEKHIYEVSTPTYDSVQPEGPPHKEDLEEARPEEIPSEKRLSKNHDYIDVMPAIPTESGNKDTPPPVPVRTKHLPPVPKSASQVEQSLPANCNILLLSVGKMIGVSDNLSQENPALCKSCSAALSDLNSISESKTWSCVFCNVENSITNSEKYMNMGEEQLHIWDPEMPIGYNLAEDSMLIFCIDISGSMSVTTEIPNETGYNYGTSACYTTRMEAVKTGLLESLYNLYRHCPKRRVCLITFSDKIKIYGDGTLEPKVLEDSELLDPDYLTVQGKCQPMPCKLEETLCALESRIERLTENGATALGPAALVAIAMASQKPGSKVIICTDGRANTDLGNLEDITEESAYKSSKLYYSSLADLALEHSVVVSVLTLEGTDCRLADLGQLADRTGGKVNIVHPLHLANEFQSILEEEITATNVKVKVYLPDTMYFLYKEHTEPLLEQTIGVTTSDTVMTLEFGIQSSKVQEVLRYSQLPIQVQLTFSLMDGRKGHRIISQRRPVTNDSSAALESISVSVLQIHSAQLSAQLVMEGHVEEATKAALALKDLIDEVLKQQADNGNSQIVYGEWENAMSPIYEDLSMYMQKTDEEKNTRNNVIKSLTDEMASMMFHLKKARQKVLNKLKHTE